jgi:hypothetical protein
MWGVGIGLLLLALWGTGCGVGAQGRGSAALGLEDTWGAAHVEVRAGGSYAGGAASRALERAKQKKQSMNGERGARLDELRAEAVEAYRRVHERWPSSGEVASEAAFRAGELLRAGDSPDQALVQFAAATNIEDGGEYIDRARYEIGHVQRREGRGELALAAFEELMASGQADGHLRDMASVWCAKVLAEQGDPSAAERVLVRLTKTAQSPLDRVRAFDELILLVVARGEFEGATGWLRNCKMSVALDSSAFTEQGRRVCAALENMRGLKALQAAIALRMKRSDYDPLR